MSVWVGVDIMQNEPFYYDSLVKSSSVLYDILYSRRISN